jgi:hypothetical protein
MSLHVPLSPEARHQLRAQRRSSTIAAVVISLLSIALVAVVLALVLLPSLTRVTPVIVSYQAPATMEDSVESKKMSPLRSKPSAPSSASATFAVITRVAAPMSVEVPEITFESDLFGSGTDDFGDGGLGAGGGGGGGGTGGGGFGSTGARPGALEGHLYDFKQKPDGTAIPYNLSDRAEFVDRVVKLQRSNFSAASLKRHFRAPNSLFLNHLAIPLSDASSGPEFFGAKDSIKPSGWMAHYRGKIRVPKNGSYRFVGLGDDYIGVFLDGRMRLAACWGDIQEMIDGRWEPSEPTGKHQSPFSGMRLVYGDWVKMKAGDVIDLDLAIGERPGGKVGFVLMIEEKGVDYRKAADGRPILPLFTTGPVSEEERKRITGDFGAWEFEWEKVPVFGVK